MVAEQEYCADEKKMESYLVGALARPLAAIALDQSTSSGTSTSLTWQPLSYYKQLLNNKRGTIFITHTTAIPELSEVDRLLNLLIPRRSVSRHERKTGFMTMSEPQIIAVFNSRIANTRDSALPSISADILVQVQDGVVHGAHR